MNKDVRECQKLGHDDSNSTWYCCERDHEAGKRHRDNENTRNVALVDICFNLTCHVVVNTE